MHLFFFHHSATPEIYTLSLHDALPTCTVSPVFTAMDCSAPSAGAGTSTVTLSVSRDRKSTRLNSSHLGISYAVFCLKKKKAQFEVHFLFHVTRHILVTSWHAIGTDKQR